MSPFRNIFGNPVFERPYSDLSLLSHVSAARKHLKPFWQHIGKNTHLEITPGSENVQKPTQIGGPNGRLAAATGALLGDTWHSNLQKTRFGLNFYVKSVQHLAV